jgi:hypothetical protein
MPSPAAAFAGAICRRHRWGLVAVGLYFALLAGLRGLALGPGRVVFAAEWQFALGVIVPLAATFSYLLAVFTFGLEGDLAGKRSIYPARMFTLPASTAALAGWPMLFGSVAMAVLWLGTRLLALWPAGVLIPVLWPALFAAVFLAWNQGLVWMPYPLPGLRVAVAVVWLSIVGFGVLLALHLRAPEGVMLALLAPQLPLAHLTARFALARARRGEGVGAARAVHIRHQQVRPFTSPTRAQHWFEGRQRGRSLPALVALVLPFELSLLFVFRDTPSLLNAIVAAILLTPPAVAAFVPPPRELTPFLATRPLTSAALLRSKLAAAFHSTLHTWLLLLAALPVALALSGSGPVVVEGGRHLVDSLGTLRALVLGLLLLGGLMVATWKQRVHSLYAGLGGPGLARARVFGTLALLTLAVLFLLPWLRRGDALSVLWNALPWLLAGLATVKMAAAAGIAVRIHSHRLLPDRTLLLGALTWSVLVLLLHGVLVWLLPAVLFPGYLLALVAILAIPLVRLSAALLALSGSRHR